MFFKQGTRPRNNKNNQGGRDEVDMYHAMREMKKAYRILLGKPEGDTQFEI
jgi:hypothetical protein